MSKKLKLKDMPENPAAGYTPEQILNHLLGIVQLEDEPTQQECLEELKYRVIPPNDVAGTTEYRGGIRPTHAPTH